MPRGRNWYDPGFWKGLDWYPGAGGFRGGWYEQGPGWGPGWGPCRWWFTGPRPYYEQAYSGPEEEKEFLKSQKEQLKEEISELEERLAELEKES